MNDNTQMTGGIDEENIAVSDDNEKVVDLSDVKKKRRPFHYWNVAGREYRLKLNADMICRLEEKYGKSLLSFIDDLPPLPVMLTIIQAALKPWEHGIKYEDVKNLYDKWIEEGNSQTELFTKVILPVFVVSGFFPAEASEKMLSELEI